LKELRRRVSVEGSVKYNRCFHHVSNTFAASTPRRHKLKALVGGSVVVATLVGCGEIVSSRRSAPLTSPDRPVKVGDVIFYNLPTGVIRVDGIYDTTKGWTITVAPEIRADLKERYELEVNQRYPFFDHNATLTTDDKGLLKTVNALSTDHSVEGIGALITAGGQALQFGASLGAGELSTAHKAGEATPTPTPPPPFHVVLDPFDYCRNRCTATPPGFTITVNRPVPPQNPACPRDEARDDCENRYAGIMTRLSLPFTVTVTPNTDPDAAASTTVLLPDTRQRYLLSVPRGPLVTSETKIEFANGSMVTRDIKRPSIGYAILGIPKALLTALVPIPGQVHKAEIDRIENRTTLIKDTATLQTLEHPTPTPTAAPTESASATPTPSTTP
jgi:hypothetical protein